VIVPLLHILLLGLSNDALSHFWDWLEECIEPLTPKEMQARNTALLAEIAVEEKEEEFKSLKHVLSTIDQDQLAINRLLKQRGLETEVRSQHLSCKASIQAGQVEARKKRDGCDIQLNKQRKSIPENCFCKRDISTEEMRTR
jgi:hypothetical protein